VTSLNVTGKETALGQIDLILIPTDDGLFDLWGMTNDYAKTIIGECKNYTSNKVEKYEIEKTCWRTCKGRCLSFLLQKLYAGSIDEIHNFNQCKESYFSKKTEVSI
jgi:hypothetical protein